MDTRTHGERPEGSMVGRCVQGNPVVDERGE